MENLTRLNRVAYNAADFNPIPGHDLVVYREVGAGMEFYEVAPVGTRFKKGIFNWRKFNAYAVKKNEHLHYEFSHPDKHVDQKHNYVLHFTVYYAVSNSWQLVEKLDSDPLKELQKETVNILNGTARKLDWEIIAEEAELERTLLDQKTLSEQGIEFSNLDRLRQVAQGYGLAVKSISIRRTLPKESQVLTTDYEETLDHRLESNRKARERGLLGYEAVTHTIIKSIGRVTDLPSATEVRHTIASLGYVEVETSKLIGLRPLDDSAAPTSRRLAAAGESRLHNDLLNKMLKLASDLGSDSPNTKQLASSLLHLVAELSLGEGAKDEELIRYAGEIEAPFSELYQRLSEEQIELIHQLQEPLLLKKGISKEKT